MQIRGEFERQRRVEFQADGNEFAEIAQEGLHWFDIAVNYNNGSIKNKKSGVYARFTVQLSSLMQLHDNKKS